MAQRVEFGAQFVELGLPRHIIEAFPELIGHGTRLCHPASGHTHETRQILWSHHHQRHDENDEDMTPA